MGIISNIKRKVIEKKQEMDERREFLNRVEEESKPFRRTAYMKQMMKEAVNEGIARAKIDAAAKLPKPKKEDSDLGIMTSLEDPFKFMRQKEVKKNGNIQEKVKSSSSSGRRRKPRRTGRR